MKLWGLPRIESGKFPAFDQKLNQSMLTVLWPVLYRQYDRNPSRLDNLAAEKFPHELKRNVPAYLEYDRSSVIVLATDRAKISLKYNHNAW